MPAWNPAAELHSLAGTGASPSSCVFVCRYPDTCHQSPLLHADLRQTVQPWESLPAARIPIATKEPLVGQSHYPPTPAPQCVWLHLVPATTQAPAVGSIPKCAHTSGFSHHHCLPRSRATGPEGSAKNPNSPYSHCIPHSADQGPHGCSYCVLQQPKPKGHHALLYPLLPHDPTPCALYD